MNTLAASFTVSGADGFLWLIAFLLFLVAAIVAWVIAPRHIWAIFVAAGLALAALTHLVT